MKKQVIIAILLALLILPMVFAASTKTLDSEMQKLTHYAEEYEVGNINYVQLMIHVSSVRESLNEILGVTNKEMGGIVKQEQIKRILGEPLEETKWVWDDGEERDIKLDSSVPIWKKIVFDGKKIQIRMEAFPSIFSKKKFKNDFEDKKFENEIEDGSIIYRLHFNTEFKRPQDQLDINAKIEEIKSLAEEFNKNPTNANAVILAKQSVTAERVFQNYFMQGQGKCEDVMKSIFGSENQRQTQNILSNEFTFYEGEDFEAVMRLEMCEECEWNYINLNMWFEGKMKYPDKIPETKHRNFKQLTDSEFEAEIKQTIENIKQNLESGDYGKALELSSTLNSINNAWSEKSNDVWEEVRKEFDEKINAMSEEDRYEFDQNYGWIKQDQDQRRKVKELQKQKYEQRKQFYLNLFSGYDIKELYFTQTDFEKRLIEEFKERGEEICNNNKDDNENGEIDCADSQCGGKVCGTGTQTITSENTTTEVQVDFYCIQSICQAKEDTIEATISICGNHICEEGEADTPAQNGTCQSDCSFAECPIYEAIECDGKVVFEGEDENGCQLPPICIEETESCDTTEDCNQPSCGISECIREEPEDEEGICKVVELTGCVSECESWEQEIKVCNNKKILTKICEDGQWKETGSECETGFGCAKCGNECVSEENILTMMCEESTEDFHCFEQNGECIKEILQAAAPMPTEPIVDYECVVATDCGGEDDVCSNGKCVQIPKVIREIEPEEQVEEQLEQEIPESEEQVNEQPQEQIEETPEVEPEEQQSVPEPEVEKIEESTPEPEPETSDETGIVGMSKIFMGRLKIMGRVVAEPADAPENEEPAEETPEEPEETPEESEAPEESETPEETTEPDFPEHESPQEDNIPSDEPYDEMPDNFEDKPEGDYEERDNYQEDFEDDRDEWEERDRKEREEREEENKERCSKDCVRPCIDKCTREACGEGMECNIEEEIKICEKSCQPDDNCIEKCASGVEDWWKEFEEEDMHKEEKGVFQVGGGCRKEQGRTEGFIWFGGWGDPFERIQGLKEQYYSGGEADWCKQDLENLIKQRQEFEKGFNQEFAQWFFEKYLPSSAEDWEQAQSGIYELYWNNVDTQRQLAERMKCLNKNDIQEIMNVNLINLNYETEFGKLEYWEEIQTVKMDWMEEETTIISPYMKVWIFPSEEFIKYEMKTSMEKGEFPGSPEEKAERKNEEGLTNEEKESIRENEKIMKIIEEILSEYGGSVNANFQVADGEEIVFNLYVQMNEKDLILIEPMSVEKAPSPDITIQIDFMKLYDMINFEEKEMRGAELESPPWDNQPRQGMVKGFTDGIRMYFKVRDLINSAKITPDSLEGNVKDLMKSLLMAMGEKDDKQRMDMEGEGIEQEKDMENKPSLTGEITKPAFEF